MDLDKNIESIFPFQNGIIMNMKQFINRSRISSKLITSTVRQIGGWEEFKNRYRDVCGHGASGGFSGFIYHSETIDFTKRNLEQIIKLVEEIADDLGEDPLRMISQFNCLKNEKLTSNDVAKALYKPLRIRVHSKRSDDEECNKTSVLNALAWFALEEVARSYECCNED